MKDLLLDSDMPLRFSGHETFPLRLLWLKKFYDAVIDGVSDKRTFQEREGIARFGVGKNMAMSMRHWAVACEIIAENGGRLEATELGHLLFDKRTGVDPYMEDPSTIWLIHNMLSTTRELATFFYAFNVLALPVFDRQTLVKELSGVAAASRNTRATAHTIKRDVEVFLRSYAPRGSDVSEDAAEPLLAELGLIREMRATGQFEFVRGPKQTLSQEVFAHALVRFWKRWHDASPTLSVETVAYAPASPGRVFRLDEESVASRMATIADVTGGAVVWTDTAGLRQVARHRSFAKLEELDLLKLAYGKRLAA